MCVCSFFWKLTMIVAITDVPIALGNPESK